MVQPLQIVRAQAQFGAQALQCFGLPAELLFLPFIAGGDPDPRTQQHFNQRRIGHADPDHSDSLALQFGQIVLYGGTHGASSFFRLQIKTKYYIPSRQKFQSKALH